MSLITVQISTCFSILLVFLSKISFFLHSFHLCQIRQKDISHLILQYKLKVRITMDKLSLGGEQPRASVRPPLGVCTLLILQTKLKWYFSCCI